MPDYPPSIPLIRLSERLSKNGNYYLTGYHGLTKINVFKVNGEVDKYGNPVWLLLGAEPQKRDWQPGQPQQDEIQKPAPRLEPEHDDDSGCVALPEGFTT